MRNFTICLLGIIFRLSLLQTSLHAVSSFEGRIIETIDIRADGPLIAIAPADVLKLLTLHEGSPYSASQARRSLERLYSTELFHDIQLGVEPAGADGLQVSLLLVRRHFIKDVHFRGQVELDRDRLRRQLALRSGQAYSDSLLESAQSRLQEIYQQHGYYRARIEPEFELEKNTAQLTLIFDIQAGERARVERITLEAEGESLDLPAVRNLIHTQERKPFSRPLLTEDLQRVELYLALQGYLRLSVRDLVQYDDSSSSVTVTVQISPGERTHIEFQGVDLTPEQLADLPIFRRRGAAPIFLEETGAALREKFQTQGSFLASVDYETSGVIYSPERVVFKIEKGQRQRLEDVRFEGNVFAEDGSLQRIVNVEPAGIFGRGKFTTQMAQADVDRIRLYYQDRGFRDVEVSYEVLVNNPAPGALSVVYTIKEGPRYLIQTVEFAGNQAIDRQRLTEEIQGRPGTPFSAALIAQDRANLMAVYENQGYRQVEVRSQVSSLEPGQVSVTYSIDEGRQFLVENILLAGNFNTRDAVIQREIEIKPGAPVSLGQILQTENNLYSLGIFDRAQVREVPSYENPEQRNLILHLQQARQYTLFYGIGFSSFEGLRGTLGITNNNFQGRASALSLNLRAGAQRQRANVSYTLHRLFGRKLPTLISLTGTNEKALTEKGEDQLEVFRGKAFDELRLVASAQTERQLSRRESLFFRYNLESVDIDLPPDLAVPLEFFREQQRLRLSSLSASYLNESRDDPTNPSSGFLLTADARLSTRAIASDEDFLRFLAQGQYYYKLFPDLLLASALRIGVITPFGRTAGAPGENPVPISERFFSGGATTLRGLPQDLAGPLLTDPETGEVMLFKRVVVKGDPDTERIIRVRDDPEGRPIPLGGNALLVANLELRFPLVGIFSGAFLYDWGNVFRSFRDFSAGFSNATGLGVLIHTPVGPIRFDVAYNPNPPDVPGFKRWNFHLSLGQLF